MRHSGTDLNCNRNKIEVYFNYILSIIASIFNIKHMEYLKNSRWIDLLEEEDLAFIKRFILVSGRSRTWRPLIM